MKKNEIIYVNKSTNLPVDNKIKEKLDIVVNPFLLNKPINQLNQINVFFVNEIELDKSIRSEEFSTNEDSNVFNPDLLGVCISKSPEVNGQTLIKVSPEKILKCAYEFKKKEKLKESHFEIYTILLIKVVLHELGHYFLSEDNYQDFPSVKWICDGLNKVEDDKYYLNTISNSNNNYPSNYWYRHLCQQQHLHPMQHYEHLLLQYKAPKIQPPFNLTARRQAGFSPEELTQLSR